MSEKNNLTEDVNLGSMVVVQPKLEYRIVDTAYTKTTGNTEIELNELAEQGWRVVGVTDHWIYLEKRTYNRLNEG